jgi:hypothetical protein
MASAAKIVNVLVVGIGSMVVAQFLVKLLAHHQRRVTKSIDRDAARSWEGEGGSVAGVNMPQPSLPQLEVSQAVTQAAKSGAGSAAV